VNIQINDCTLRDGGYLFDKNLPEEFIKGVAGGLVTAGIDIIEIGFLQDAVNGESLVYGNSIDARKFIPKNSVSSRFTGFCDNSRYSLKNLDNYDGQAFEYLRISFAKHESKDALDFIEGAKAKGYSIFANPMDAPSYTREERSKMIAEVNRIKPYAFSIVDTFGTMYVDDLRTIFAQVDDELEKSIQIGLHSHNNLQLSTALAEVMIDLAIETGRGVVVDGSLYGMGRGAGNASTEVIAAYLNKKYEGKYDVGILFDTIERYIIPTMQSAKWGYDLPMFICGIEGAHVDNIFYLQKHIQCSANEILQVISSLNNGKRKRYGANYSKSSFADLQEACDILIGNKRKC
jgi:4-hydroxy 2-oxovalerate aldolase